MKKTHMLGLLGLVSVQTAICLADATIQLSNLEVKLPLDFGKAKPLAAGDDFYVQVLAGPVGGVLTPVSMAGTRKDTFKLDRNGFFQAGVGVVRGVDDHGYAEFQIRAWYRLPKYKWASVLGLMTGHSERWLQRVGTWDPKTGLPPTGPALVMKPVWYHGYLEPIPPLSTIGIFDSSLKK